ncbi:MAG: hypothetical protein B6U87_01815, partial [Candidatus Aenigmarchaeota archaeon ex4484_52]
NRLQFTNEDEIDIKINDFNIAYKKYSKLILNNPEIKEDAIKHIDDFNDVDFENKDIKYFRADKICFLRIVRQKNDKRSDEEDRFINIMKHKINLPKNIINLFVFAFWILN